MTMSKIKTTRVQSGEYLVTDGVHEVNIIRQQKGNEVFWIAEATVPVSDPKAKKRDVMPLAVEMLNKWKGKELMVS